MIRPIYIYGPKASGKYTLLDSLTPHISNPLDVNLLTEAWLGIQVRVDTSESARLILLREFKIGYHDTPPFLPGIKEWVKRGHTILMVGQLPPSDSITEFATCIPFNP